MVPLLFQWLELSFFCLFAGLPQPTTVSSSSFSEAAKVHPFSMSVTEINHNAATKTIEISCKMLVDELGDILKKNYNKTVDLPNGELKAQNDQMISNYILKHLSLRADGKALTIAYVGFEIEDEESAHCYFEVPHIATLKKLDMNNSLLQDLNEQQINIIHVVVNGQRKSSKLEYPQKQASFSF